MAAGHAPVGVAVVIWTAWMDGGEVQMSHVTIFEGDRGADSIRHAHAHEATPTYAG